MLLVCSRSTKKFFPNIDRSLIISSALTKKDLSLRNTEEEVIAIGGGAVIDAAKMICKNPIVCYPTTAAGTSFTSHSVYWDGSRKYSTKECVPKEVHVVKEFIEGLPDSVTENTKYDVLSHCFDSMWSINKTKESLYFVNEALEMLSGNLDKTQIVKAGNIAGKAIELCPTTILHSLSYPLTGFYNISHGRALGFFLPEVCKFMNLDLEKYIKNPKIVLPDLDAHMIAQEALTYDKIFNIEKDINFEIINKIIEVSNNV